MKIIDAYILARTKRKTRRIRTALVVIVSSLLFAFLFGVAFIGQGVIDAGKQVGDVGFNARNLTTVSPTYYGNVDYDAATKKVGAEMDAELKTRKVKVTDQVRQDPAYQLELNSRVNKQIAADQAAEFKNSEDHIRQLAHPTAIYHFSPFPLGEMALYQPDPAVDPLVELIKKQQEAGGELMQGKGGFGSAGDQLSFYNVERAMFESQLTPGQTFDWQPGQPYPIIISYGYLEQLGDRPLTNLGASERNKGYRDLIKQFSGTELRFCYRNSTARDQLHAVMQYNMTARTDKDSSTTPLDVPICANFDQKLLKKKEIISDEDPTGVKPLFPPPVVPAPDTQVRMFKIVGFTPAQQYGGTDVVTQMLTNISTLPTGPNPGIIPTEIVNNDPLLMGIVNSPLYYNYPTLFADFATRAEQKAFVDKSCSGDTCGKKGGLFIMPFGNIAASLEGVFTFVSKTLLIAAGVIMIIAALMILFTISKVIADSTKEIAVFRSLGARRRDIAQIYYTYGMMLAGSALVISVAFAAIGAMIATRIGHDRIAQALIQAAGAYNTDVHVVLLGLNAKWLAGITIALLLAAFIGISFPILMSLRRKLITILREE